MLTGAVDMKMASKDYYQVEGQKFCDYNIARMFANIVSLASKERIPVIEITSGREMVAF